MSLYLQCPFTVKVPWWPFWLQIAATSVWIWSGTRVIVQVFTVCVGLLALQLQAGWSVTMVFVHD
jgi:ABC-type amino acid transport system permease subunit